MTGFSKLHSIFHNFPSTNFPDHNNVRRLSQGVFKRYLKRIGIQPHFPLRNNTATMFVDKLYGILNADDMPLAVLIPMANYRSQ